MPVTGHAGIAAGPDPGVQACGSVNAEYSRWQQEQNMVLSDQTQKTEGTRAAIIAVGNQKGGVGKSTNSVHLAAAIGLLGKRVLLIDLDPAAGATKHLGVPANSYSGTLELLTTDESLDSFVLSAEQGMPMGVDLVPSRPQLSEIDTLLSKYVDRTRILERVLLQAHGTYDYVFLDTSPSAAFTTTVGAYCAADWFLLSAFPHPLSLGGLTEAFRDIVDVRKLRNPGLDVLGVIFSNVDGRATRLRLQLEQAVNEGVPGRAFATSISQAVILPEVSGRGVTLFQMPKWEQHAVAQQYLRLAVEVIHRVKHRDQFLAGTLPNVDYGILEPFIPRKHGRRAAVHEDVRAKAA
jgi:chromosome partitioning protein